LARGAGPRTAFDQRLDDHGDVVGPDDQIAEGQISLEQRTAALAMFHKLVSESFIVLPVTGGHFRAAAKFADQHLLGLGAGDALHMATASEHGASLHTLDRRLAQAGPALGVPTQLLA
jgi:hypothetical protein